MSEKFLNSNDGALEYALGLERQGNLRIRIFELYYVDGILRGMEHEGYTPSFAVRSYGVAHDLRGKSAHFIIISHDTRVSYDVALKFASAIHNGAYSYRRVDLSPIQGFNNALKSRKKGLK